MELRNLDIVQRCLDQNREVIGGFWNPAIMLSDELVPKFGYEIRAAEADD